MQHQSITNILKLRKWMQATNIDAVIISSSDPHSSEFVADHWQSRQWVSGFTGSAGYVVVTQTKAALWTDGRYFIQAEAELKNSEIKLIKQNIPGYPTINQWLEQELTANNTIAFEGSTFNTQIAEQFLKLDKLFVIKTNLEILNSVWDDRPELPANKVSIHELKYAGKTHREKLTKLREKLVAAKTNAIFLNSLDDIAWLINMRGADIEYNPVFFSYAFVSLEQVVLFVNKSIFKDAELNYLEVNNITIADYKEAYNFIANLNGEYKFLVDKISINLTLFKNITKKFKTVFDVNPVSYLKAIKNKTEISQMHECHIKDGIAMVKFIFWVKRQIENNKKIDELAVAKKNTELREANTDFVFPSFPPIVAYKQNGAICHYSVTKESNIVIENNSFLLVDSGGQYLNGTTDITRTIPCGELSPQEITDYTMVLKSHIALATCLFPTGTTGIQLDTIARSVLWQKKCNFNHGTGHGVGYYLYVHEGPQSISPRFVNVKIEPGMLITNEPGIYRDMQYGIRLENIMLVVAAGKTEFGEFYKLEPMTLAPFDMTSIDFSLLTQDEINWLNNYHQQVYNKLSGCLTDDEKKWLKQQTYEKR